MILVGEFGSGKTELAIHHALMLAAQGVKSAIVDIDIVKPYFRTRESRELLEASGVYVVAPEQRLANSDLPILPQDLSRILYDDSYQVVMDVGGGDSAIVLGQLRPQLAETGYEALLVVNTLRPFTADSDGIVSTLRRIEQVSRLTVSGLIANTNIANETTAEHILAGLEIVKLTAERLQLPMNGLVAPLWLKDTIQTDVPLVWLNPRTRYPWME
jgi:cellulose biosynthesis protein BcsQ